MIPVRAPISFYSPRGIRKPSSLQICIVFALAALIFPMLAPSRAQAQQMKKMKLLTPTTGWVSNDGHLYWTTDSGSNWTDITPVPAGLRGVGLLSVYFLNTQEGWAVISYPQTVFPLTLKALRNRKTLYDVAQTVDGGQTWSFLPLTYPHLPKWEQEVLAGPGHMFFLDSMHGWLIMTMSGSSNFAPARLLATDDGGRNWKWVNSPDTVGTLLFTSMQDGWLAGGPGGHNLYMTRDGGANWEDVNLKVELQGKTAECGVLGPPHFTDKNHGFVAAGCAGKAVVAFATSNAGKTWKTVKILRESQLGGEFPVAIADSTLIVPTGASSRSIKAASVPLRGQVESSVVVSRGSAFALSFADSNHGLAWPLQVGGIQYTSDGGATWKSVTPRRTFKKSPSKTTRSVEHPRLKMEPIHPR